MKTNFQFSNLLGTVYCQGNLTFTPDGTCLLSPVGSRVTVFDLVHNVSFTLPLTHRRNISHLALSRNGNLLLTIDEEGHAILTNYTRRVVIHHLSFQSPVTAVAFSPTGHYFVVGVGRSVEVWNACLNRGISHGELEFSPFTRYHRHAGHNDTLLSINWSGDGRFFLTASKDLTVRLWSLHQNEGHFPVILAGHRQEVKAAWFSKDQEAIYSISKDGALFQWRFEAKDGMEAENEDSSRDETTERWRIVKRSYFHQNGANVNCAALHADSNLLVIGFSNGLFAIYELPDAQIIYNLSMSHYEIDYVDINKSGEWLAFGASKLGQLLVWEWQSESYILKQQGHFDSLSAITYTPDGQKIIACTDDGKVKVWDINSGFCIVVFTEHTSAVTACEFSKRGNILFTSSLDGSVRAWDLTRYRNFRSFTAPTRLSYTSIAVDPSGEIVCAGSQDSFAICVWSVQTGQLLDELAGHEGPISSLVFSPNGQLLVSASWDHSVRIWNIFARTQTSEPLQLQADCLAVAIRPDSKQIAVSCLDGTLSFWSVTEASQEGGFDVRRDVSGGRKLTDRRSAANVAGTKSFSSLDYSADGSCVLASGNSKYICLYDVLSGVLLKKFTISVNLSLDGTQEILNSISMTEAGPRELIDAQVEESNREDRLAHLLPGAARKADISFRRTRPEIRVPSVAFSPTSRAFCAASTEGLIMYSLDQVHQFDPLSLDIEVTPAATQKAMESGESLKALVMAFRINDTNLIQWIYERVPSNEIGVVIQDLPLVYIPQILRLIAQSTEATPHLEFNLLWTKEVLSKHGRYLKDNSSSFMVELRILQRVVRRHQLDMARLSDKNGYAVDYLLANRAKPDLVKFTNSDSIVKGAIREVLNHN